MADGTAIKTLHRRQVLSMKEALESVEQEWTKDDADRNMVLLSAALDDLIGTAKHLRKLNRRDRNATESAARRKYHKEKTHRG